MYTKFFGFKLLAVCVAAAVVGIGLFLAPMEKAQGQFSGSGIATVPEVDLDSFSFIVAGDLDMSISFDFGSAFAPVFHWSGIYWLGNDWGWVSVDGGFEDFRDGRATVLPFRTESYYYPGSRSDYYVCRFGYVDDSGGLSIDEDSGWVEVWVWTGYGGYGSSGPSAWVYDSDGNRYDVDLAIGGYVISGPSLD